MAFFAARQPILTHDKVLHGYELLFRNSMENVFPVVDDEKATSKMMEGLSLDLGLENISSGELAFINFTKQSLLLGHPLLLPADKIVVEILESVSPCDEVYEQIKHLNELGYTIALDDFIHCEAWEAFYPLCKIIKVDCLHVSDTQLKDVLDIAKRHPHLTLLAEKVETIDVFKAYSKLGFTLFQGYFFSKPEVIKGVYLSPNHATLSSLLSEITKEEVDTSKIVDLLELDPSIAYKLLRYAQSPLFMRRNPISSIRQAVIMLGQKELEKFISLLCAATFGEGKTTELMKLSLQRAKLCDFFAMKTNNQEHQSSAFLVGMFSLLDAMLDAKLSDVLNNLPLGQDIKKALTEHEGWLYHAIEVCFEFERGDWDSMQEICKRHDLDFNDMLQAYSDAIMWSEQRLKFIA